MTRSRFRYGAALRRAVAALFLISAAASCGDGKKEITFYIRDNEGNSVPGVVLTLAGSDSSLGVSDNEGQVSVRLARRKGEHLFLRFKSPQQDGRDLYSFGRTYEVTDADLQLGRRVIRAWRTGGADSLSAPMGGLATLRIVSIPDGADVKVNDSPIGKAPAMMTDLPIGPCRVEVTLPGYATWSQTPLLTAGMNADTARLERIAGSAPEQPAARPTEVPSERPSRQRQGESRPTPPPGPPGERFTYQISTSPGYAEVYVDGGTINLNQAGNFKISLSPGIHRFHLVNLPAGVDLVINYTVPAGENAKGLILNWKERRVIPVR